MRVAVYARHLDRLSRIAGARAAWQAWRFGQAAGKGLWAVECTLVAVIGTGGPGLVIQYSQTERVPGGYCSRL
eukprot:5226750-Pyramimonas_sp.AAC.1